VSLRRGSAPCWIAHEGDSQRRAGFLNQSRLAGAKCVRRLKTLILARKRTLKGWEVSLKKDE